MQDVPCSWGGQLLVAQTAFVGTLTLSFNGPVVTAPPRGLPIIPASLSALCLCRFPSPFCPQVRIKYSNFSKHCFSAQLIIHVFWFFFFFFLRKRFFYFSKKKKLKRGTGWRQEERESSSNAFFLCGDCSPVGLGRAANSPGVRGITDDLSSSYA